MVFASICKPASAVLFFASTTNCQICLVSSEHFRRIQLANSEHFVNFPPGAILFLLISQSTLFLLLLLECVQ